MNKYEKYKHSGIEWIGEIPEHWAIKRLKYLGFLYGGLAGKSGSDFNQASNPNNKPFIPFTNICNNIIIDPQQMQYVLIEEGEQQNKVQKGDLFFMMSSENFEDVGKSTILLDDLEETYLNSFCKGFRFTDEGYFSPFVNYLLLSKPYRSMVLTGANGFTRINLKIDKINDIPLIVPPDIEEQTAIATYLDRKTAEIDQLIEDKKHLVELYHEEKTALINQTVTKGLNYDENDLPENYDSNNQNPSQNHSPSNNQKNHSSRRFKDSGIEWLGEIPEHWMTTRINRIIKVKDGTHETPIYLPKSENSFPLVTSKDFIDEDIDFDNSKYISKDDHDNIVKRSNTEKGDIIMSMIGGNIGNLVLVKTERPFSIKNVCLFKTSHDGTIAKHLYFILKSDLLKIQISLNSRGGAQGFLSLDDLRGLVYFILPYQELQSIVHHIETECSRIVTKIERTQRLIELLAEYRTALISEVVTGKVKVV